MEDLRNINILHSLGKLYLSIYALSTINGVTAFPAVTKSESNSSSNSNSNSKTDSKTDSKINSKTESKTTNEGNEDSKTTTSNTSPQNDTELDLGSLQVCHPNTNSCGTTESCIRFDTDKNNKYTCHKTELSFCESDEYCKTNLGEKFMYCYLPPWATGPNQKKQCFTEHNIGFGCLEDGHCEGDLVCVENVCVLPSSKTNTTGFDFNENSSDSGDDTILGINKWVFISVISFPVVIIILCLWCWIIGRSSSKIIENRKKEKYENELKELTMPTIKDSDDNNKNSNKSQNNILPKNINSQKEIEEEVGKRGLRSIFKKKKSEDGSEVETEPKTGDISSTKVGGKAPINTSFTTDTQKKMKKNLSLVNVSDKNTNAKRKIASKKSPTTPVGSNASSIRSFRQDAASTTSNTPSKASVKSRANKKKSGVKKAKRGPSSTGNDTNTNNSTSSKQSSQRGLVNNTSGMSSALSGQSASYFSNVSSLDAQSAIYYQQMYNAAAAQAAAQNQYYASYMQNPYYAAAAQQNAAYYAAAAQDPNNIALYNSYHNQSGYQ